ncbi:hypothetical protein AB4039_15365 [Streptomyces sp. M-16]|uniref:hypothetical protein n=1 Tax=Streptomyces sp. M-16 TaxID=3233040 RepID=UPI003F9AAF9A
MPSPSSRPGSRSAPRRFVGQWAVYVAVERHPERAARLHALEAGATQAGDLSEARAIAAEIGHIIDVACAEAGIEPGAGAR